MQEPKKTTLRNFDPVLRKFPQESKDPVQDLSDRGVDPRALDEFVFDCINTAMQQQVPGNRVMFMVACSCFHMGMLTQDYLSSSETA